MQTALYREQQADVPCESVTIYYGLFVADSQCECKLKIMTSRNIEADNTLRKNAIMWGKLPNRGRESAVWEFSLLFSESVPYLLLQLGTRLI